MSNSKELYELSIESFKFLLDLGFEQLTLDGEVDFCSEIYRIRIIRDRYGEPPTIILCDAKSKKNLPSPYLALQYLLDDYLAEWRQIGEGISSVDLQKKAVITEAEMLKKHSFLLLDDTWTRNRGLLEAVQNNEEWFVSKLSKGIIPSHEESVKRLHSMKPASWSA